jgi:dihydropteroate synthase
MAILNLTPDSFSDGGKHFSNVEETMNTVRSMISSGAHIIDIGGQSTRPNAPQVSTQEEIDRILPAIQAIRKEGITIPISVDTYRAKVAEAAISAGADVINDVSAGQLDPDMLSTAAELNVPIVLMHMRGTPSTMTSLTKYDGDLIEIVARELIERVNEASRAGIRRWNILLDPGLGFAKTGKQNLELMRRLPELRAYSGLSGMPWVLGPSRKRFIKEITGEEVAAERIFGTAGAIAACVQGGADIVRVHDVAEMYKIVKMSDAIWRNVS